MKPWFDAHTTEANDRFLKRIDRWRNFKGWIADNLIIWLTTVTIALVITGAIWRGYYCWQHPCIRSHVEPYYVEGHYTYVSYKTGIDSMGPTSHSIPVYHPGYWTQITVCDERKP